MKQIGSVFDNMGKEYQLALTSEQPGNGNFLFGVYVRTPGRSWTKQENFSVSNSQQARSWAEKQLANGGLKIV